MKRLISVLVSIALCLSLVAGPAQQVLVSIAPATGGGGGSWHDTFPSGQVTGADGNDTAFFRWFAVTLPTGNATKLRAYIQAFVGSDTMNLGLYNAGGTRLQYVGLTPTGTGFCEGTITTQAVTAGTYYVLMIQVSGLNSIGVKTVTNAQIYDNSGGVTTPPTNLPGAPTLGDAFGCVGVFVQ